MNPLLSRICRRLTVLLLTVLVAAPISLPVLASPSVSAEAAILIEATTGDVLYEKNARERRPMASTTKIMTAVVALENSDPGDIVRVSPDACGIEGSSIYLTAGETRTMEELLYALLLESANDAAAAIAMAVSGSIDAFAAEMNETAARLGLRDTHFTNPHGLDNEAHYTTAADLATLTAYALQNETFRTLVSTRRHTIPASDDSGVRCLINHNKLLRLSERVIGVKTGFTKRSGRCLVSAAEENGVTVIAVTLNAPDDWNDHLALHTMGLSAYERRTLAEVGEVRMEIPCTGAPDGVVTLTNREPLTALVPKDATIEKDIVVDPLLFAPIDADTPQGTITYRTSARTLGTLFLYPTSAVPEPTDSRSPLEKLRDKLGLFLD